MIENSIRFNEKRIIVQKVTHIYYKFNLTQRIWISNFNASEILHATDQTKHYIKNETIFTGKNTL